MFPVGLTAIIAIVIFVAVWCYPQLEPRVHAMGMGMMFTVPVLDLMTPPEEPLPALMLAVALGFFFGNAAFHWAFVWRKLNRDIKEISDADR